MSPRVEWLTLAGDPDTWRSLGFVVTDDGRLPLYGTSLRIVAPSSDADATSGITGWTLSGVPDASTPSAIDGLPTTVVAASTPTFADHPVTAVGLDHVVVLTPDLERTSEPRSPRRPAANSSGSGRSARCGRASTASARAA
jgi:hypothetical protein